MVVHDGATTELTKLAAASEDGSLASLVAQEDKAAAVLRNLAAARVDGSLTSLVEQDVRAASVLAKLASASADGTLKGVVRDKLEHSAVPTDAADAARQDWILGSSLKATVVLARLSAASADGSLGSFVAHDDDATVVLVKLAAASKDGSLADLVAHDDHHVDILTTLAAASADGSLDGLLSKGDKPIVVLTQLAVASVNGWLVAVLDNPKPTQAAACDVQKVLKLGTYVDIAVGDGWSYKYELVLNKDGTCTGVAAETDSSGIAISLDSQGTWTLNDDPSGNTKLRRLVFTWEQADVPQTYQEAVWYVTEDVLGDWGVSALKWKSFGAAANPTESTADAELQVPAIPLTEEAGKPSEDASKPTEEAL